MKNMPEMKPILIDTKNRNWFYQLYTVIFNVRNWEITKDWYFQMPTGEVIMIPAGFVFDGASVPKLFWFLLSPVGVLLIPGLIHDYGYRYGYLWSVCKNTGTLFKTGQCTGQKAYDKLFKDISLSVSGLKVVANFTYYTLRAFGFMAWRDNRKRNAAEVNPAMYSGDVEKRIDFTCD